MASEEDQSPLKGPSRSSSSRNDCDESHWASLPNNLEITSHSKPSKKQRNKEKGLSQEAAPANASEGFSTNSSFQNFPRAKCNTASWLKDEKSRKKPRESEVNSTSWMIEATDDKTRKKTRDSESNTASWLMDVTDEKTRKKTRDSEEVFSDTDLSLNHGSMNFPVSHAVDVPEHPEELQRPPSRSIIENENTKSIKDDCKKSEGMREEFNKIKEAMKQVTQGEREHKFLLQQMASESGGYVTNGISSSTSKASNCKTNISTRDSTELMSLKLQESLLYHKQKKAENKSPSFQATLNVDPHEENNQESARLSHEQMLPCHDDQTPSSSSWFYNSKVVGEPRQWVDKSLQGPFNERENTICKSKEPQDIKQLHMSLELIKKQVQLMQQNTDLKNMTRSPSPDESELDERVARVEFERKKLTNKLLELQEKKKVNAKLLQELSYLRGHAADAKKNENEANFAPGRKSHSEQLKGKKKAEAILATPSPKYHKLHATLQYLEGMMKSINPEENVRNDSLVSDSARVASSKRDLRNIRSGSCIKHNNVRKDKNSGFPARRHYEAEGRANEDADMYSAPLNRPPTIKKHRGINSSESQEQLKKLQDAQKRMLMINDLITSLEEHDSTGKPIPVEHQRLMASLDSENNNESWVEISSSDSEEEVDFIPVVPERKPTENITSVKEVFAEGAKSLQPSDDHEQVEASPDVPYNTELSSLEKDYEFLKNRFNRLMLLAEQNEFEKKDFYTLQGQLNPFIQRTIEGRSDDTVRSSGEGGYVPNRNADSSSVSTDHIQPIPPPLYHQDNLLLTRQNIATIESRNQSSSSSSNSLFLNRSSSSKKDNINNLSGKMGKICIQNAVNSPFSQQADGPKDNLDSRVISAEMRKTILDILKRSRKKQKMYDINHDDQVFSNSSIDSETLEGCHSVLATDATVAGTWRGSRTQEVFEDENNESARSLRVQHDVLDGFPAAQRNAHHPTPKTRKTSKMESLRGTTSGSSNELPRSDIQSDNAQASLQNASLNMHKLQNMSLFIQQIQRQIYQLNTLCHEKLSEIEQSSLHFHQNTSQSSSQPLQPVPENIQPYNQQLLLCLSQCYHSLYLQQLEIQHLHRCLRHNIDAEVLHQASNLNPQGNNESGFRPWNMPSSNLFMPSGMYPNEQISPIIHPTNQENTTTHETLNNQVPPRTRANNFLDNFRSYSRQNMLSMSNNTKRNENISLPVAPQIRQVHPLISNDGLVPGPNSRTYSSALQTDFNRSLVNPERPLPNSRLQDVINRSKKPNISPPTIAQSRCDGMHKKGTFLNTNFSDVRNIRSEQYCGHDAEPGPTSSVNLIQLHSAQDDSKVGNFPSVCPTLIEESAVSTSSHPQGEFDYNSDFIFSLYREAKALKSHVKQQQALNTIRNLAISEDGDIEPATQNKVRFMSSVSSSKAPDHVADNSSIDISVKTTDIYDPEKPTGRLSESSIPSANQSLPTAAISPLSKQTAPKAASTGAIRKKTKLQSTCFWDSLSNTKTCPNSQESDSAWESCDVSSLQPIRENAPDFPGNIIENIILDLQAALPFGQRIKDSSISFWCSINAYVINRIRVRMNVPLPHKSLASLRQSLDHGLSIFLGIKFCDCEAEFLKYISQFVYDSITCFMATGRFTSTPSFTAVPDVSSQSTMFIPESNVKAEDSCVKMSIDSDKTRELRINMPADDVFPPQFQPVLQQNITLGATETEDGVRTISPHPMGVMSEAEVRLEWGTEVEAEPEVEAGTEADLAEADQSPGQGSTSLSSKDILDLISNNSAHVNGQEPTVTVDESEVAVCANEDQKLEEEVSAPIVSSDDSQNGEFFSESN